MARYALIQLESLYLTSTGLVGGRRCRHEITGLDAFAVTKDHGVIKALSGLPYLQIYDSMLGKPISIRVSQMLNTVYANWVTEIQNVLDGTKSELDLDISGSAYGTFSIDVVPDVNPIQHAGRFTATSYVQDVTFNFLSTTN